MTGSEKLESFEGDLATITQIQEGFLREAKEFIYFRKGEFDNIAEILARFVAYVSNKPEIIIVAIAAYPGARAIAKDILGGAKRIGQFARDRRARNELAFRIIAVETAGNRKELEEFERKGAGVCRIPEEKSGRIRFFVNENRFCLFVRQQENDFFGVMGSDKLMIHRLRGLFEREYIENKT